MTWGFVLIFWDQSWYITSLILPMTNQVYTQKLLTFAVPTTGKVIVWTRYFVPKTPKALFAFAEEYTEEKDVTSRCSTIENGFWVLNRILCGKSAEVGEKTLLTGTFTAKTTEQDSPTLCCSFMSYDFEKNWWLQQKQVKISHESLHKKFKVYRFHSHEATRLVAQHNKEIERVISFPTTVQ